MRVETVVVIVAVMMALAIMCGCVYMMATCYEVEATVYDLEGEVVTFETESGDLWQYETKWHHDRGEQVDLVMYRNNTDTIYDDVIVFVEQQ